MKILAPEGAAGLGVGALANSMNPLKGDSQIKTVTKSTDDMDCSDKYKFEVDEKVNAYTSIHLHANKALKCALTLSSGKPIIQCAASSFDSIVYVPLQLDCNDPLCVFSQFHSATCPPDRCQENCLQS
ncbi:PMG domain-containing protein [Rhizoctonia solani AG-1 IA]|uniref:PMG domain-containing protein n=1 Tax=Thanatephorus cucumeris (strain AG1-IA) TaxID=983506 RepID=L8X1H5_THACA|nr:PMG domain-containing protein [Rhizoctonia solani AG-1 IA]